ncbi:hypothetical protein ASG22_19070 [Chryseobacterium sp. Leaf405]|nr:hypothetical protein ASG22_19070 [Chryseobacterium sp. Leaf405]
MTINMNFIITAKIAYPYDRTCRIMIDAEKVKRVVNRLIISIKKRNPSVKSERFNILKRKFICASYL